VIWTTTFHSNLDLALVSQMKSSDAISVRINELIAQAPTLYQASEHDQVTDGAAMGACQGWLVAATNIVELACASGSSYFVGAKQLQARDLGYMIHHNVLAMVELLKQLRTDIDRGLLTTLERQVSAETYDDLIDHAAAYLGEGRKDPAGTIVSVVFEDTIRRICRVNGIDEAGKTSEPLINALTTANILTKLEGKEAKAASDLRANATHAWWDRFNAEQVRVVIEFTRRLIREKLAS
jgi:hypothetical protein